MKKLLFLLIAAFAVLTSASAQNAYERKAFVSSDGISLNYRELTPAKIEAKKSIRLSSSCMEQEREAAITKNSWYTEARCS